MSDNKTDREKLEGVQQALALVLRDYHGIIARLQAIHRLCAAYDLPEEIPHREDMTALGPAFFLAVTKGMSAKLQALMGDPQIQEVIGEAEQLCDAIETTIAAVTIELLATGVDPTENDDPEDLAKGLGL